MGKLVRRALAALVATLCAGSFGGCSVGEGDGRVTSDYLRARGCFEGPFDLKPTFFGTVPYRDSQIIRLQHKDDSVENSDGVQITVHNTSAVRARLGQPLRVGLPPGVTPPGIPIQPDPEPPLVEIALYLHDTCHGQNIALYALSGAVVFQHLFSGDPDEEAGDERLTEGSFDVMLGDPRDQPPAGGPVPADTLTRLVGDFRFFFERGQPAQPYP